MTQKAIIHCIIVGAIVLSAQVAHAGTLGIALDSWLDTFLAFMVGLGIVMATIGLLGWVGSMMESPYGGVLSGGLKFFVASGVLGGGQVILGAMGLARGAVLL